MHAAFCNGIGRPFARNLTGGGPRGVQGGARPMFQSSPRVTRVTSS